MELKELNTMEYYTINEREEESKLLVFRSQGQNKIIQDDVSDDSDYGMVFRWFGIDLVPGDPPVAITDAVMTHHVALKSPTPTKILFVKLVL